MGFVRVTILLVSDYMCVCAGGCAYMQAHVHVCGLVCVSLCEKRVSTKAKEVTIRRLSASHGSLGTD